MSPVHDGPGAVPVPPLDVAAHVPLRGTQVEYGSPASAAHVLPVGHAPGLPVQSRAQNIEVPSTSQQPALVPSPQSAVRVHARHSSDPVPVPVVLPAVAPGEAPATMQVPLAHPKP